MKARQFHDHLTSLGIPVESVVSRADGTRRIDFAKEATEKQREQAEEELRKFDWSEPTEEEIDEEEDRREFARLKPLAEAMIEAMRKPSNINNNAAMRDTQRLYMAKRKRERNQKPKRNQ